MRYELDTSFLTGLEAVDGQHGQLFDAINGLLDAVEQNKGSEELQRSLDFLAQYTINHFFDEEQLLKKYGYSDFYRHHQYHEAFTKSVREFSDQFAVQGSSGELIAEVEKKIGAWLTEHIKGQDFRWAMELKGKAPELFTGKSGSLAEAVGSGSPEQPAVSGPAKRKKRRTSILAKMAGLSSILLVTAILVMAGLGIYNMRELAFETAVAMTENKLQGDLTILIRRMTNRYGILRLEDGKLCGAAGETLEGSDQLINELAGELGIISSIFVRDGEGFRRLATTVKDENGSLAVGIPMREDNQALKPLLAGESFTGEILALGRPFVGNFAPIFSDADKTKDVIGAFYVGVEMSDVNAIINRGSGRFMFSITAAALGLLIITLIFNFTLIKIILVKPVRKIIAVLKRVEEGDIAQQIRLRPGDEIGEMAGYFDRTLESLKRLVMIIQNEAEAVDDISEDLSANMTRTAEAMNEINAAVQHVQTEAAAQSDSVAATNAAMEKITENITGLNSQIEEQTSSVSRSSSAIEEMLANIDSVTRISRINSENVSRLADASGIGRNGLKAVAEDIAEVARESEGLLEINSVLQTIASQTNLLSMNAAIEAAHAGEAGKGFAVVADEIRKLAENSGAQSKTISAVLKKIRDSMAKITGATASVLDKFEVIDTDVKTVSNQEEQIRNAMEEQSAGSKQILEAMEKLNEITGHVKSSSEEMQQGSKEIINAGNNLKTVTAEITSGMNEMAYRAGQVNSSVRHVNSISRKNKSNIEILREAISHFVITDKHYLWDESMLTGIQKVDEQHKQLVDAVNGFIDAVEQGTAKAKLQKLMDFITSYTVTHFADEEEIQKLCAYPDFENHHILHEKFKETAVELAGELNSFGSSEALVKEVKRKIGDWLVTHIKGQDCKIGEHIRSQEK
ncbi:hypothetical protein AGMMS50230_07320 [Spirochaetia bacterium]|nr:hypothetical protein AGMMS50230_07320 [Spirochaetia bacterium]